MSTETHEEFPRQFLQSHWPEKFTKRRPFDRPAENQPYIEYLRTPRFYGEEDEADVSSEEDDGDDVSSEHEDDVDGHREKFENEDEDWNDDKDAEPYNGTSDIRLFMEGMTGDEGGLRYRDQADQVANFCERASSTKSETKRGEDRKHVALLDERNIGGTIADKKGHCRPYLGPLTSQELREKLSRKRFRVESEKRLATNSFEDEQSDAERIVVFITNLDPSTIDALATTASRTQAPALQNLFYKHLMGKTSIGVTIPSHGFTNFVLDFHIPFYVMRESEKSRKDTREKFDGEPLRQSLEFPFLSMPMNTSISTDGPYYLYEAQTSVVVTGIDHWVWAAYGVVDTYFDSEETVDGYHELNGARGSVKGRADPLAAGWINADEPIWTPREYFFRVFEFRMNQVLREWNCIVGKVEKTVERTNHVFPLSSNDRNTRQEVRKFTIWNGQMVKLLRLLIRRLSDAVGGWEKFRQKEIWYFLNDGKRSAASPSLKLSVDAVDTTFSELKEILRKLQALEKELCEDSPQGVNAQLIFENNEAAIFQQQAARHLEVLTVITVVFFPLVLAANLFSTTGVLPFTPNLVKFIYVFLILAILILTTLGILYKWRSWSYQILEYAQKAIIYCNERLDGEGVRRDAPIISPKALKRKIFPRRRRKTGVSKGWDVEKGTEKAKAG